MMNTLVKGIHHITSLASDAQKNVDFYADILGLRLVKKTINFDVPEIYHLYYGNEEGSPGTIMTFFPYPGIQQGRKGKGQLTVTSFSIPEHSINYWIKRLDKFHIPYKKLRQRFDELVISLEDLDGLGLELIADQWDERSGFTYGNIPSQFAIKGFYGITLVEECYEKTANVLVDQMDHKFITKIGNRFRYSSGDKPGNFVDILCSPETVKGLSGYGTVHHVAFATETEITQLAARERLLEFGLDVTPVLNREYFFSIYFREPGGVLFEIATVSPGFSIDEPFEHLGEALKLPPWEESNRASIEQRLPPIRLKF